MLDSEKLNNINKKINNVKINLDDISIKNIRATKKEFLKISLSGFLLSLFFLSISFLATYFSLDFKSMENIFNTSYSSGMKYSFFYLVSFNFLVAAIHSLFFMNINSKKTHDAFFSSISSFFSNLLFFGLTSFVISFLITIVLFIFFVLILMAFDIVWDVNKPFICYGLALPFYFYHLKQNLSACFKDHLKQDIFISEIEEQKHYFKKQHNESLLEMKSFLLNNIHTIDDYKLLKLTCYNMNSHNIEQYYKDIEEKLIKGTDFKDFKSLEKHILLKRAKLNIIENI